MSSTSSQNHLLSLKVLRLSKPSFHQKLELDPITETQNETQITDILSVPGAFGNIYLGETFTSYLCVNNDSLTAVQDVAFKAELQTASQRFTLADTIGASPAGSTTNLATKSKLEQVSLLPKQSAEFILHHEIKELGIHILVCSVHYTPSSPSKSSQIDTQRKFFRKFFKFQVLNPLSVKTKVNSLEDGRICLEIQVQNQAIIPLYLQPIQLDANKLFTAEDMCVRDDGSVFDNSILQSQDTRQYLFILHPKDANDLTTKTTSSLGSLDIYWTSTLGQVGHLQTSQLVRKLPSINPFEMSIVTMPKVIKVEKPFKITFRIRNNLEKERLRLSVHGIKAKMSNLVLRGSSVHDVGTLDGQSTYDFELEFFPLVPGLHKLCGLSISEKLSGSEIELAAFGLIHVLS
jgi:trafficking protein particle complex subunit 13